MSISPRRAQGLNTIRSGERGVYYCGEKPRPDSGAVDHEIPAPYEYVLGVDDTYLRDIDRAELLKRIDVKPRAVRRLLRRRRQHSPGSTTRQQGHRTKRHGDCPIGLRPHFTGRHQ